jgi:hypothetical protein
VSREAWERVGKPRAISWDVWEERGYPIYGVARDDNGGPIRVTRHRKKCSTHSGGACDCKPAVSLGETCARNREAVIAAYETLLTSQQGFAKRIAGLSDGLLIQRYAPPGLGLPPIYPEMRPDNKVLVGQKWTELARHDFDGRLPDWRRDRAWERDRVRIYTLAEARFHIVRHPDHGNLNASQMSDDEIRKLTLKELREIYEAGAKKGTHRHLEDPTQYVFAKGEDPNGRGLAARLDMHPLAARMLDRAEFLFFCIEGCLKADSILTGIVLDGLRATVVSVPAVWLWKRNGKPIPELGDFFRKYALGKPVVIVPDADWHTKYAVREAARECKDELEAIGLRCCVAAPPYDPDDLDPETGKPRLNGVDDYRADGRSLLDLCVVERGHTPHLAVELVTRDIPDLLQAAGHTDGRKNLPLLEDAVIAHDTYGQLSYEGKVRRTIRKGARKAGINKNRFDRGTAALVDWGIYEVEDSSMERVYNSYTGLWEYELVRTLQIPEGILPKDPELSLREWLLGEGIVVSPGKSGT